MSDQISPPPHAELKVTVIAHGVTAIQIEIKGCNECLAAGIALVLTTNNDFKELINKAVRIANERRQRKEN